MVRKLYSLISAHAIMSALSTADMTAGEMNSTFYERE
jgi:hypothetical protein